MLELNQLDRALLPCPLLLDQQSYLPDTVELTEDIAAREYWLACFTKGVHKVLVQCKIKMKYILLLLTFIILLWYVLPVWIKFSTDASQHCFDSVNTVYNLHVVDTGAGH